VEEKYHLGKKPKELWEDKGEDRKSYKDYPLKVFRDHIYQEIRLKKWQHYTIQERMKKGLVLDKDDGDIDDADGVEIDDEALEVVDDDGRLLDAFCKY